VASLVLALGALSFFVYMIAAVVVRAEKPDGAMIAFMGVVVGAAGAVLKITRSRRNGNNEGSDDARPGPS